MASDSNNGKSEDRTSVIAMVLLAVALIWSGWWATRNFEVSTLAGHEFRQAQTALSAQVMRERGFELAYHTPVLGKPWSIPMEFPLYQWSVALLSEVTGAGISTSGRTVALIGFALGLVAVFLLGREAGLSSGGSALATTVVMGVPVLLFDSRTVMIESTAWAL